MLDFREKTQLRKIVYSKVTLVVFALILFLVARGAWGMYDKSVEASAKRDAAAKQLVDLVAREKELNSDIDHLSTDRGIEEEIRNRFMVAKEGENVIIVSDPANKETPNSITVPDDTLQPSLWQKMFGATAASQ